MIKQFSDTIPTTPGVYFFKDPSGRIVYIGKALNLRNRLRGHPMLKKADKLEWQETGSEIGALIIESQFIKKYKPRYNISLRDDKSYVYVAITHENFPKILITHKSKMMNDKGSMIHDSIGPFTSSTELRAALKAIRKLIPYCTCKRSHLNMCLNGHLGLCLGFCCLKMKNQILKIKIYRKNIQLIQAIFSGKKKALKAFPRVFENIKVIKEISGRDFAIEKLEKIFKVKNIKRIECYDISNIQGTHATGSMIVFENGYPNKNEYRKFKIKAPASPNDILMLDEMLSRRFNHTEWQKPDLILIDGGIAQFNVAKKYFSPVLSIAKGKLEIFASTLPAPLPISHLPSPLANLILHLDAEAHRFAITYYRSLHTKSVSARIASHV